jgi:hypothetical protein
VHAAAPQHFRVDPAQDLANQASLPDPASPVTTTAPGAPAEAPARACLSCSCSDRDTWTVRGRAEGSSTYSSPLSEVASREGLLLDPLRAVMHVVGLRIRP